jgi:hypothetical protein
MSLSMSKSTQFKINELVIVTKAGPIDISVIYEEINIYDSLFLPVMSGNILIRDAAGLSGSLLFDGSSLILQKIVILILVHLEKHFVFTNSQPVRMKA